MDISDIWWFLPRILFPAIGCAAFHLARTFDSKFLRILTRTVASVFFTFAMVLLLFFLLFQSSCTKRGDPIYSPDGKHMALLRYALQGALGADYANVEIRSIWNPFTETVYSGEGSWDFKHNKSWYPEVRWLDNSRLLIRYYDDCTGEEGRGGPAVCRSKTGDIEIVCVKAASVP